jgi:hypothetical protein
MFAREDGTVRTACRFEHETLWLSQAANHAVPPAFLASMNRKTLEDASQFLANTIS